MGGTVGLAGALSTVPTRAPSRAQPGQRSALVPTLACRYCHRIPGRASLPRAYTPPSPVIRGSLFTRFYLDDGIRESEAYRSLDDAAVAKAATEPFPTR